VNTGAIVYIVGGEDPYDDFDMKEAVMKLNINADRVEVVFSRSSHNACLVDANGKEDEADCLYGC